MIGDCDEIMWAYLGREGVMEQGEGEGGDAEWSGQHEDGEGEKWEQGGGRVVVVKVVATDPKQGQGRSAHKGGEDVEGLSGEASVQQDEYDAADNVDEGNNDCGEMLNVVMTSSLLEDLDGVEVYGELAGEDHEKYKAADSGKGVHVLPIDGEDAFNEVRGGLLVLQLLGERSKVKYVSSTNPTIVWSDMSSATAVAAFPPLSLWRPIRASPSLPCSASLVVTIR